MKLVATLGFLLLTACGTAEFSSSYRDINEKYGNTNKEIYYYGDKEESLYDKFYNGGILQIMKEWTQCRTGYYAVGDIHIGKTKVIGRRLACIRNDVRPQRYGYQPPADFYQRRPDLAKLHGQL